MLIIQLEKTELGKTSLNYRLAVSCFWDRGYIPFRREDPSEFPDGYNIVIRYGQQYLPHGPLVYLRSRRIGINA